MTNSLSFSGSKSVKTTFVDNTSSPGVSCGLDNPSIYYFFSGQDWLFTRAAVRKSPGFLIASSNSTKMFRFAPSVGGAKTWPVLTVLMYNQNYTISLEGGWSIGSVLYQGGPPVSSTAWDQVETEWKMNTPGQADGLVRLWVNGTLYIERLNLQMRGPTPSSVNSQGLSNPSTTKFSEAHIFIQCGIGNMWWDRVAVGNTRIGPASAVIDNVDPFVPEFLTTNPATKTISWSASFDPVPGSGLAGYHLRRCNPAPCNPTGTFQTIAAPATSYVDASAQAGVSYSYTVNAFDVAGNDSLYTLPVNMAIPPGPSVSNVTTSAASNTTNSITFAHTVLEGSNKVLVLCTAARDTVAGDIPVLSATRGGVALTKVRHDRIALPAVIVLGRKSGI